MDMDFLKIPSIPEDAVQYQLFVVHPAPSDAEAHERFLQRILQNILAEIASLLVQYIWQHQAFNLRYHPEKGMHLYISFAVLENVHVTSYQKSSFTLYRRCACAPGRCYSVR